MTIATSVLYISEPGTSVHRVDERLVLRRNKQVVADVPMLHLGRVVVIGRGVEVSGEALTSLAERGIAVLLFTRNLRFRAKFYGEADPDARLRFLQARTVDDPAHQLEIARQIVVGKLANQAQLLKTVGSNAGGRLGQLIERLPAVQNLDQLRGFEGQGAALYFEALRQQYPVLSQLKFTNRKYYPPPDPVNALLSYGYSLLTSEVLVAAYVVGFDPYLGFFHVLDYGRPSLALDLVEEFRPVVVDRLVLRLVSQSIVTLADFEQVALPLQPAEESEASLTSARRPQPGRLASPGANSTGITWRLRPPARNRFLQYYEEILAEPVFYEPENRRRVLRQVIELQARVLAGVIVEQAGQYRAFRWR